MATTDRGYPLYAQTDSADVCSKLNAISQTISDDVDARQASVKVAGTSAPVTSTTSEVPITNWTLPVVFSVGSTITYSAGKFVVSAPTGVYRATLTVLWPTGTAGYRNTQNFLVNGSVVQDGEQSYNTGAGVGAQVLTSSAEFQLASGGTVQAGLISTTGGVSGVQPICFSLTRVA